MRAAAVVVAAGRGERFGAPKQFVPLGGIPLALWSCRALLAHPTVEHVVLVLPPGTRGAPDWLPGVGVSWCPGGESRRESACAGVESVPEGAELILIHDAARPFVRRETIEAVLAAAAATGAALPTVPVSDTIKRVEEGRVVETIDRRVLARAQTPQGFSARLIREVHARARQEGSDASDDAYLCERSGHEVVCVAGDPGNLKITTAVDFALAEWLVDTGREAVPRGGAPAGGSARGDL